MDQIVDELEKTGVADAATSSKLRKTEAKPKREVEPISTVDAMLAIFIHDPDTLLTDLPAGDRLNTIAAETLNLHDPIQKLHASTYVRAVVSGGGLSISEKEVQVRSEAPGMMKDVLQERELDPECYRLEVWAQELSPKIKVVWVAAIRK